MKNHMSMKSPFDLANECSKILPTEIINKIFTEHNGLIHPTALMIKEHMLDNYIIKYTQIEYYIKYENLKPKDITESWLDCDFITMGLQDADNEGEESFYNSWCEELEEVNPNIFNLVIRY